MIPLRYMSTRGLGSAGTSYAKVGKVGKLQLPLAERKERLTRLTHQVHKKILVRPLSVPDLLKDPELGAYETELRSVLATLVNNGQAKRVKNPYTAKVFYKGVTQ